MRSKLDHGKAKSLMSPGGRKSQNSKLEKFRAAAYRFVGSGEEHEKRQQRWETRAVSGHPFCPDVRPGR